MSILNFLLSFVVSFVTWYKNTNQIVVFLLLWMGVLSLWASGGGDVVEREVGVA